MSHVCVMSYWERQPLTVLWNTRTQPSYQAGFWCPSSNLTVNLPPSTFLILSSTLRSTFLASTHGRDQGVFVFLSLIGCRSFYGWIILRWMYHVSFCVCVCWGSNPGLCAGWRVLCHSPTSQPSHIFFVCSSVNEWTRVHSIVWLLWIVLQ
jgi:hypothetical protein